MLSLPTTSRIFVACGPTDMRKAINGLSALTKTFLGCDPCSGDLFVFCNRRRDRVKILFWEESGFWLFHKRLEKGTFAWPALESSRNKRVELDSVRLAALLGGLDLRDTKKRRWFSRTQ